MKKIILLVGLCLLMAPHVYASCEDGTEVTGLNGHVYCRSRIEMNWYTAFAWCEAHGRTLVTMEQLCDIDETQKWDGGVGNGKCLNIIGIDNIYIQLWTANPYGTDRAFSVQPSSGNVGLGTRLTNVYDRAMCW